MEKFKKQPKSHTRGLVRNFRTGRNDSKLAASKNAAGYDNFGVPLEVFSLSIMSCTERKNLRLRLKLELEQVRKFMKKFASVNSNPLPLSSSSDTRSCSNGQKRSKLASQHGTKRSIEPMKRAAQVTSSSSPLMNQCHNLLGLLMSQKNGWVFNNPVDVVALKIPDYFTVIKHPMDLGTVKSRITSGRYSCPKDFAADVRLTFSNAMIYNPPGSYVHGLAKKFSSFFETRWKSIEKKIPVANSVAPKSSKPTTREETEISDQLPPLKKKVQKNAESCEVELPSESLQLCTGNEPAEEDVDILGGSDVPVLSFPAVEIEKDDATANSNSGDSSSSSSESSSSSSGSDSSSSSESESDTSESSSNSKESAGCSMTLDPGKKDHGDSETRKDSMNRIGQIEQSSHYEAVAMEGCLEGESASERKVSPDKLFRAASLRSRFADTILKAKEKALEKVPHKPIIEREQFIRRQKVVSLEKAQLQAEARATEEAQRKAKAEAAAEAKRKRKQERQAARQTLENMKKTVDINENSQLMKDLEMLGFGYDVKVGSDPLEELGLDTKLDEDEDEEELTTNKWCRRRN